MNTNTTKRYMIQERHLEQADKRLSEVARRAERIGQSFRYGYQMVSYTVRVKENKWSDQKVLKAFPVAFLHIQAAPVVLAGWTLAAVLEPVNADNNMVRMVPGTDSVDSYWRTVVGWCDHCKTNRLRNMTFVVRHKDGSEKSVGSSCLQDFLGRDVHAHLAYIDYLAQTLSEFASDAGGDLDPDDFYGGSGQSAYAVPTLEWLTFVALEIRENGWLSKSAAYETGRDGAATADCAFDNYSAFTNPKHSRHHKAVAPSEEDNAKAEAALAWIRSGSDGLGDSEYAHNLRLICSEDHIVVRMRGALGITASIFVCYDRFMERETERKRDAARPSSYHVGEVKKRQNFDVEVAGVHHIDTDYGMTVIYRFIMDDGPVLTWFSSRVIYIPDNSSGGAERSLDIGDRITIKATVKSHGEYKGTPQTIITRGAVQSVNGAENG